MDSFRILSIFDDIIRLEKGFLVEMLTRIPFTSLCSQWQCTTGISSKFRSFVPSEISGKCNTEAFQNWRRQHRVRILAKICTKCNINVGQKQKPDDGMASRLQNLMLKYLLSDFSWQIFIFNVGPVRSEYSCQVWCDLIPVHDGFGKTCLSLHFTTLK